MKEKRTKIKAFFSAAFLLFSICILTGYIQQEGKNIETVTIGKQIWMKTNLDVDRFRNADLIPEAKTDEEWIIAGRSKKPVWCYYNNDPKNNSKLYNWYAVNDPRGLAPEGWHIPTLAELKILGNAVCNEGSALKAIVQGERDVAGTNISGFSALLAGCRDRNGTFFNLSRIATFWSSTEYDAMEAYYLYLYYDDSNITLYYYPKGNGFSVRCLKD